MKDFSNYGTITQYLEARYGSRFLRTASAFLSMIALISIVGSQVSAVLAMVVIIALTSMGGLKAVTVTDGFQIILVMIGVVWVTVVALGDVGGFAGLNSSLAAMTNELPADYNVFMTPAHAKTLLWMILPGFMYTMLTALQAIDLSDHKAMSPVTQKVHDHARQTVTFMENDDLMYQRIEAMEHLVESNQLLADCPLPFTI